MESKYHSYLASKKQEKLLGVDSVDTPWRITYQLYKDKRFYVFETADFKIRFSAFSSLNDFMISNGLSNIF